MVRSVRRPQVRCIACRRRVRGQFFQLAAVLEMPLVCRRCYHAVIADWRTFCTIRNAA